MGILYGISTGPGDPELLTLKAVRTIAECGVIACPQTASGECLALRIAEGAVNLSGKTILPLKFPMTRDRYTLAQNYDRIAEILCKILETQDVGMLCLGDLSVYATFPEIGRRVAERGFRVESIPGVTSFCAAAARAGKPLASSGAPLQVLPWGCEDFTQRLRLPGGKVILKCGAHLSELTVILQKEGLLTRAYAVENCGLENECYLPLLSASEKKRSYFTVVCIAEENTDV